MSDRDIEAMTREQLRMEFRRVLGFDDSSAVEIRVGEFRRAIRFLRELENPEAFSERGDAAGHGALLSAEKASSARALARGGNDD